MATQRPEPHEYDVAASRLEEGVESFDDGSEARLTGSTETPDGKRSAVPYWQRPITRALIILGSLVVLFTTIGLLSKQPATSQVPAQGLNADGSSPPAVHRVNADGTETALKRLSFDEAQSYNPLVAGGANVEWLNKESDDGYYLVREGNTLVARHVVRSEVREVLLDSVDLPLGFAYTKYELSADWQYVLLTTHYHSVWRHSFTAIYYVFDVQHKKLTTLLSNPKGRLRYAKWSPRGHRVVYVNEDNNLFVSDLTREIPITSDGSATVLNGILDWVYEEEIFSDFTSAWWSPDGECLTYLRIDDDPVPIYSYPLYEPGNHADAYTKEVELRYPKPGYPNPLTTVHLVCPEFASLTRPPPVLKSRQVEFEHAFDPTDSIVTEIKWMTESHDQLFIRVMNRVQDHSRLYLVQSDTAKGRVVREINQAKKSGGDGAWVTITTSLTYLPASPALGITKPGYLDLDIQEDYTHLAFFDALDAKAPTRFLTKGSWDVIDRTIKVDLARGIIYYSSTEQTPIQQHVYRIKLDGTEKTALTPPPPATIGLKNLQQRTNGTYATHFSNKAGYYVLNYRGPEVPWFKIVNTQDSKYEVVLQDNAEVIKKRAEYALPLVVYRTIEVNGIQFNVKETRPHNFNPLEKHAVLFNPYGGPDSQMVNSAYSVGWHDALVSQTEEPSLKFIVAVVDSRGTAHKGRKFLTSVNQDLGRFEAEDQINVAKFYQKQAYVDDTRLAIWGWSYGGYLTSKVIEANSGVFKLGIAVAPVTHWNLYDSMYTERYMKTPQLNPHGYDVSGVQNMEGFKKAKFLLMHGTGDDNVHFQQSAYLVDSLTMASVTTYQVQYFVDSDHRNTNRNANSQLYDRLKRFLFDNFKAA
ncbi:Dpp4p [Dimargaris cristalligena]|nr:Dpp4p [Dimargaris cristalligena]